MTLAIAPAVRQSNAECERLHLTEVGELTMLHPAKEWKHFAAMLLIGDGVMALVNPQWDAEAWAVGPLWWKKSMGFFRDCPILTRVIASAQIAGGIWWALSQEGRSLESDGKSSE